MGRPKSRQKPRTTMSIRISERERREIEEKAIATGMTPSAYIRTMALDGGNVDTTIHDDRHNTINLSRKYLLTPVSRTKEPSPKQRR